MPSRIHCRRGLPEVRCALARPTNVSSPSLRQFHRSCRGVLLRRNSDSLSGVSCRRRELYHCITAPPVLSRVVGRPVELLFFVDVHGWRVCDAFDQAPRVFISSLSEEQRITLNKMLPRPWSMCSSILWAVLHTSHILAQPNQVFSRWCPLDTPRRH